MRYTFPRWLLLTVYLPFVATMLYGIAFFPDAPLRERDGAIAGKTARPRTVVDYRYFRIWERTLIITGTVAVITMAGWFIRHPPPGIRFDALWRRQPPKA
jgi:uncharacterized membrane protein